jgi:hypothetical protein
MMLRAIISVLLLMYGMQGFTQPVNDLCADATPLIVYDSEEDAIAAGLTVGDSRFGNDAALDGIPSCSGNFYRDDVWYVITAPINVSVAGIGIRVYFGDQEDDIASVGAALYDACNAPTWVFCANAPPNNLITACLAPGETIYLRVWSAEGGASDWETGWGTFRIAAFDIANEFPGNENILWGEIVGEGDFNGGLNDWTSVGVSCSNNASGEPVSGENAQWVWDPKGSAPTGVFFGGQILTSRTMCNGAMVFNSEFYDNGGIAGNFGNGVCPALQEGHLISPIIDISAYDVNGVSLVFHQNLRQFQSQYYVDYSLDGGQSWTEIEINTTVEVNSPHINEEIRVPLSGAEGSTTLQVRFRILGYYYYWVIDDVRLIERECNNLAANPFFTMAPFQQWHCSQLSEFPILIDIENVGACPQTNVVVNYRIENAAGEEVFATSRDFGTLAPDELNENTLWDECVSLPSDIPVGRYLGSYEISSDSVDFDPTNNRRTFQFEITDEVMGITLPNSLYSGIRPGGDLTSYTVANHFHITTDCIARAAEIGIANTTAMATLGESISIYLYEWDDLNGNGDAEATELTTLALNEYEFKAGDPENAYYLVDLLDANTSEVGVDIKAGKHYVLSAVYSLPAGSTTDYLFFLAQVASAGDFTANNFAMTPEAGEGLGSGCGPNYGMGVATNGADLLNFFGSFVGGSAIGHHLILDCETKVNTTTPEVAFVNMEILPNPVSDLLSLKMNFLTRLIRLSFRLQTSADGWLWKKPKLSSRQMPGFRMFPISPTERTCCLSQPI